MVEQQRRVVAAGTKTDPRVDAALDRAVELGEVGVQVAAYVGDELVVDSCIGVRDAATGEAVEPDTLFPVFSVTKALTATVVHLHAERGLLELDEPIATYWPEYARKGKGDITIRHVLTHRAGVPQMPPDLTVEGLADWDSIVDWLADVEPICPPGVRSMYHSTSFGYLLGEVVRRTDPGRRLLGRLLREEILDRLDISDVHVGLPASEEPRVATLTWGEAPPSTPQVAPNPIRDLASPQAITPSPGPYNRPETHQACMPSAGGIMSARDAARFFALLANGGELGGVRLLSEERLRALTRPRPNPDEVDEAIGMRTAVGIGGYWVAGGGVVVDPVVGSGRAILSHGGAGGSIGWADIDSGLAAVITHNRMFGAVRAEAHPFVALGEALRAVATS